MTHHDCGHFARGKVLSALFTFLDDAARKTYRAISSLDSNDESKFGSAETAISAPPTIDPVVGAAGHVAWLSLAGLLDANGRIADDIEIYASKTRTKRVIAMHPEIRAAFETLPSEPAER